MKNTLLLLTCLLLLGSNVLLAQNEHFTTSGTIEFNKTANIYALIQKSMWSDDDGSFEQQILDAYKKDHPQFKVLKSTLTFGNNKTMFTPEDATDNSPGDDVFNVPMATQNNIVYSDLSTSSHVIQKQVFEQTYLIKDSTRQIKWKITDETREIAGYTCRRANAIIMDSVYVVAFYTDKIHVSGGPETFSGLPGMILGVALPHENVTWFATKVTDMTVEDKALTPPKKGKPVNDAELKTTLQSVMKNWGKEARQNLKAFLL